MKLKTRVLQLVSVVLATLSVANANSCPSTFVQHQTECYKFDLPASNWQLARQACQASEPQWMTDLVVFDSEDEYKWVTDHIHGNFADDIGWFIGVFVDSATNKFTYVNGTVAGSSLGSVPYLDWADEPGTPGGELSYPTYRMSTKDWIVGKGSVNQRFVCELTQKQSGKCDEANNWKLGPDKLCHKIDVMPAFENWNGAREQCKALDADLVIIRDNDTNRFIYKLYPLDGWYPNVDVWIGGRAFEEKADPKGYNWRWPDNSLVDYHDWSSPAAGQLDPSKDDINNTCISFAYDHRKPTGRWNREECVAKFLDQTAHAWCTRTPVICLSGWDKVNKMCYYPVAIEMTWDNANEFCKKLQGRLIQPQASETIEYLKKELKEISNVGVDYSWVGLHQPSKGAAYVWAGSGGTEHQDFWVSKDEPTKPLLNRGCARMETAAANPLWLSTSCNDVGGFICEVPLGDPSNQPLPPIAPTKRCEVGWTLVNREWCYLYRPVAKDWIGARTDCKNLGGDLVQIKNGDDQEAIMTERITDAQNVEYWIGLQRENDTINFKWRDEAFGQLTLTNWDDTSSQSDISKDGTCGIAYTPKSGAKSGRWDMRNCATPRQYVCTKKAELSAFTTTKQPGGNDDNMKYCGGNGWQSDPFSGNCYQFNEDADTTWHSAELVCETNGGNLVSILDPTEHAVVNAIISSTWRVTGIWTGLNLVGGSNLYAWTDQSPLIYFKWKPGEPNTASGACAAMYAETGEWSLKPCTDNLGFVCKKKKTGVTVTTKAPVTQQAPPGQTYICKPGYIMIPGTTRCIALFLRQANYDNAKLGCNSDGATLATIRSRDENNLFLSLFNGAQKNAWIGLENSLPYSQEMYFKWVDGSIPTYTNWMMYEPLNHNSGTERSDCVFLTASANGGVAGRWDDMWCISKVLDGYFCEMPAKFGTVVPTTPPAGCPRHSDILPAAAYEHNCYYFGWTQTFTYYDAKSQCEKMGAGGQLVSILTQQEQTFLAAELLTRGYETQFYTGLNGNKDAMYWADGSRATFYNFAPDVILSYSYVCATIGGGREYHGLWYTTDCYKNFPYICKVTRDGWSIPTTVITTPQRDNTKCKDLFSKDPVVDAGDNCYVIRGGTTYLANTYQKTFSKANSDCRQLGIGGSALATIQNTTVNNMIFEVAQNASLMKFTLWLGLSSSSNDSGFIWANGDPFYYNNFAPGQPSTANSVCVYMDKDMYWYISDCFQYRNYVCIVPKPHVYANATTRPTFTVDFNASQACGAGDSWALADDKCYWLSSKVYKNWYDANAFCRTLNASLTSIEHGSEQSFVERMIYSYVPSDSTWIGLNELDHQSYKWADGLPLDYTNWDLGQPNDQYGAQLCVKMRTESGKWLDEDCTRTFAFVCKKWLKNGPALPTTAPMSGDCPPNFHRFGNKCFFVETRKLLEAEVARNECAKIGRGVFAASIVTPAEQQFIISLMRGTKNYVWIGLVNKQEQGSFDYKWISEDPFTYANWGSGQPAGSGVGGDYKKYCVLMRNETTQAGRWYEELCSLKMHYACSTAISSAHKPVSDGCKPGYKRSGNSCWQISTSSTDTPVWTDAITRCNGPDFNNPISDLAVINDVYDQSYLNSQLTELAPSKMVWIGLHTMTNGIALWQNGWPVLYTNWNYDQPAMSDRTQCVAMNTATGKWSVIACNTPLGYICRDTKTHNDTAPPPPADQDIDIPGPCPASSENSWLTIGSYCYYVNVTVSLNFNAAVSYCMKLGGSTMIASVPSERTHNILMQKVQEQQTKYPKYLDPWIGYLQTGGSLESVDGTPVTFAMWENGVFPSQPGNSDPQCVFVNGQSGYWLLQSCASSFGVICRQAKPMGTSTTRKTTALPATQPTRSIPFTLPDGATTPVPVDSTLTIVLVILGVLLGLTIVLIIVGVYLARQRPDIAPEWLVRMVGTTKGGRETLEGDKSTGVVNEVYESAAQVVQLSEKAFDSAIGIEGPATSEGGTI